MWSRVRSPRWVTKDIFDFLILVGCGCDTWYRSQGSDTRIDSHTIGFWLELLMFGFESRDRVWILIGVIWIGSCEWYPNPQFGLPSLIGFWLELLPFTILLYIWYCYFPMGMTIRRHLGRAHVRNWTQTSSYEWIHIYCQCVGRDIYVQFCPHIYTVSCNNTLATYIWTQSCDHIQQCQLNLLIVDPYIYTVLTVSSKYQKAITPVKFQWGWNRE